MIIRKWWQFRSWFDLPWISSLYGLLLLLRGMLTFSTKRRLTHFVNASRRFDSELILGVCERLLRKYLQPGRSDIWRERRIGWERYHGRFANIEKDRALSTSLLLKEPGPNGEKGVLYCSFEFNWMKLIAHHDVRRLFRDYILVGASSWSPGDHAVLANLCGLSEDPAFIGISNRSDIARYNLFAPSIYPLPLMACDWIDPTGYVPVPHYERSIDIVMVAHFAQWKRHWLLFEALRSMDRNLTVVLIGRQSDGRTERDIRNEAKAFGVKQELIILRNLEIEDVMRYQCDARVAVALSKREGACVSVTESMFADTPVLLMDDAHIGAREYINAATGRIASRPRLAHELSLMIEKSGSFSARQWALKNITAQLTSQKLNSILRQHNLWTGRPWTRDIAPLCWRYVPRYLDPVDPMRLAPALDRLQRQYGVRLNEFVSERHALRKVS